MNISAIILNRSKLPVAFQPLMHLQQKPHHFQQSVVLKPSSAFFFLESHVPGSESGIKIQRKFALEFAHLICK